MVHQRDRPRRGICHQRKALNSVVPAWRLARAPSRRAFRNLPANVRI